MVASRRLTLNEEIAIKSFRALSNSRDYLLENQYFYAGTRRLGLIETWAVSICSSVGFSRAWLFIACIFMQSSDPIFFANLGMS